MKALLLVVAIGILAAQEPPEFPAGHFCVIPADAKSERDHPCNCREHDDCSKPEEGQGNGPSESKGCLQYCHKDHCRCKTKCE